MTRLGTHVVDPTRDLVLERIVDVPPVLVWKAWTTPEILMKWFTPVPWSTVACELDLRPGGIFSTVMRSPEGQDFPNLGCVLEVVDGARFAWTSALGPGFRPQGAATTSLDDGAIDFTAVISIEPHGSGTKYTAVAIHGREDACRKHKAMGFHDGWGTALTQLVAVVKGL
ncbi:MAG: SRPBCC family protein [Acidobacteriota bacterium]